MASNSASSHLSHHKHQDWTCHGCGMLMFINRSHCSKCKKKTSSNKNKRPQFDSWTVRGKRPSADSWSLSASSSAGSVIQRRTGDWDCPNCEVLIFASKSECRKCKAQKPVTPAKEDPPQKPLFDKSVLVEEEERKVKEQQEIEEYQANPDRCPCGNAISWRCRKVNVDCRGPYTCRYGKCGHGFRREECWKC